MKSIQTKILLLSLFGILISTFLVGGIGITRFKQAIDADAVKILNLTCSEKAQELNTVFERIEQSVEVLSEYAQNNLESVSALKNDAGYLETYTEELAELADTIVNATEGSVAIYVRFNPDITNAKAGFFKIKDLESGAFKDFETTDFSRYSPNDEEYVGWYYLPVQAGHAIWMQPYINQNIGVYMISYVVPIYREDVLIGVAGMDIDFNYITEKTDAIHVYDTGHAFLMDRDLCIVHSMHYEKGTYVKSLSQNLAKVERSDIEKGELLYTYSLEGDEKKVTFREIANDMYLAVTVPVSEIDRIRNNLVMRVGIVGVCIAFVFIVFSVLITKNIVRPLKELNVAAKGIAEGNLDVVLKCNSKDEVGTLTASLRETARQLKIRIDYISNLAYTDKLTGVQNNTAYADEVDAIKAKILYGGYKFAIFVIDVNGLKKFNDNYGHAYGNELIMKIADAAIAVFGYENIYRIGGDEFTVILQDADAEKCEMLEKQFEDLIANPRGKIKLSAAIGNAISTGFSDDDYDKLFEQADERMYQKKQEMKARGETSELIQVEL